MLKKIDDRLFLIGVAHVLPKSMSEVKETIAKERPDVVAVELCPARYLALTQPGKRPGTLDAARAGPKLLLFGGLIHLLQSRFSRQTGMPAGEEMLVAIKQARAMGARVELIDRDVGFTFQRLINRMRWRERLRLLGELLIGIIPLGKRMELEQLTDEQTVSYLVEELKRVSPTAYEVLIRERDAYMASKLAMLLAENTRVVCVVGAGHVPGIFKMVSKSISKSWRASFR